ncbi:MAG: PEGA domain-containing protein [Bacteroidia bacterium]
MKKMYLVPVMGMMLLVSSCATIVSGSKQEVKFTSSPANADIVVDGNFEARTPATVKLVRKKAHTVVIRLTGYKDYEVKLERKFNAWYIGNIGFGGIIGLIVDPITGAMYKLTPKEVKAELGQATTYKDGDIHVQVALQPEDTKLEKIGQLERL